MALVSFKLDVVTEVVGGWDPHDKEFVLYIFDLRPQAVTMMLWSNLCDYSDADKCSTDRLRDRLANYLGITAPEGFWERVERKEAARVRYELVDGEWFRGLNREDRLFQVPMFDEPPYPLTDSDIEVVDLADNADDSGEVTSIRPRQRIGLVG